MFVVDGQQMDNIDNIDPSSIASMEVLKDGASAAIYGSKSANGVVLITTKSGKSANAKVEFNYTTKYSFITSKIPVSNTKQKNRWAFLRAGGVANDSLGIRSQFVVDVQDLMYQAALSTQANVAVTGGNDNAKYYWNTALLNETGVMIGTSYKRINSNLKLDINLFNDHYFVCACSIARSQLNNICPFGQMLYIHRNFVAARFHRTIFLSKYPFSGKIINIYLNISLFLKIKIDVG